MDQPTFSDLEYQGKKRKTVNRAEKLGHWSRGIMYHWRDN